MDSNNFKKKLRRKLQRHQQILAKETGVTCCNEPTEHLAICNFGQINGLNEEIIIENYRKFGTLSQIQLIPGKSCAFFSYKALTSAVNALEATSGRLNIAQDNKPVFLTYVVALPLVQSDKVYDQFPPGLKIIEDFINEEEERKLLDLCHFDSESAMKHRQVKHFGYEFCYNINNVDKNKPLNEKIPSDCKMLFSRLNLGFEPDQLTVNHYKPGQGIPPHIDTHSAFEDPIFSLSLSSPVIMEFKNNQTFCVLLPPRSLLIMSGESRYKWTHGIIPRKFDFYYKDDECVAFKRGTRVSFTFRKIRKAEECDCIYKEYCDSFQKRRLDNNCAADKLENLHVHEVYEDIAGHFSETRHKPWPKVLQFVKDLPPGAVLVDVGCGNGKYFGHNLGILELGTDRSVQLNHVSRSRGFEVFTSNCLNLPLKNNSADAMISIAVIHHLSTEERRLKALSEIIRVLKPGGKALLYVWAKQQVIDSEKSAYIKQDRKHRKGGSAVESISNKIEVVEGMSLPVHSNRCDFSHSDVLVPWKLKEKGETLLRFYHVFEEGELEGLCRRVEGVRVLEAYYDQGNYCVLVEKMQEMC